MAAIIIDYGAGNLHSIQHKLRINGIDAKISSSARDIKEAKFLIISGVGNFSKAMKNMRENDLVNLLNNKVIDDKTPILGICLGMQLFTKNSEEGNANGFGWLDAETRLYRFKNNSHKVPHIGWTTLKPARKSQILEGIEPEQLFYFVHSYHVICNNSKEILTTSTYGNLDFVSSVHKNNIFGTQFHPEKSHRKGMKIIVNFYRYARTLL